jgi:hypothetical protein
VREATARGHRSDGDSDSPTPKKRQGTERWHDAPRQQPGRTVHMHARRMSTMSTSAAAPQPMPQRRRRCTPATHEWPAQDHTPTHPAGRVEASRAETTPAPVLLCRLHRRSSYRSLRMYKPGGAHGSCGHTRRRHQHTIQVTTTACRKRRAAALAPPPHATTTNRNNTKQCTRSRRPTRAHAPSSARRRRTDRITPGRERYP